MSDDPVSVARRIGPVEVSPFGAKWVAVRCPHEFDALMRQTGGLWEGGSRRWLIERRLLNPLIRKLRRMADPLFRQAGIDLDEADPLRETAARVAISPRSSGGTA